MLYMAKGRRGEHLTTEHQQAAGRRPRLRMAGVPMALQQALDGEPISDEEWTQIKYRIDATKLEAEQLKLNRERGLLVTKEEAIDAAQAVCQRWVSAVETISTRVRTKLADPAIGDRVAALIEDEVLRIRTELGG